MGLGLDVPGSNASNQDMESLEATKGGMFVTSCATMTNTYFSINTLVNFIIKGPQAQASRIKTEFEAIEVIIASQIEKLDEVLVILNELLKVDVVELDQDYLDWFVSSPYIRRILGEYTFHATYETLKTVDADLAPDADALRQALLDQAIAATEALLRAIGDISFESIIQTLNKNLIPVLFEKSITVPLPSYMYPQVTTNSRFRGKGDTVNGDSIGVETSVINYRAPEFPIPDPTDPTLNSFLISGDLSDLSQPLLNASSYNAAKAYWTSNWRAFNIPGINGPRVGVQFATFFPEIDTGAYGPTLTNPLNHRSGYVSAFAVVDSYGVTERMDAWVDFDTGKSNPDAPHENAPTTAKWSFMDLLYELHEITLSIDGVCIDAPAILQKWNEILDALGIAQFISDNGIDAQYMIDHMPTKDLNGNAVIFGTNIVQAFGSIAMEAQAALADKILEVESKLRQLKT